MYSALLFNKPLSEIQYQDVVTYFTTPKPESQNVEFKAYVVKGTSEKDTDRIAGVIRTICGFLNSEGGILIWGSPEGKEVINNGTSEKVFEGNPTPVAPNLTKDQFIAKIVDSITPTPNGILYHQILCPGGGYIYLFEVARSIYPPHQFKNIYWMRLDGNTRAAPHYYVEALMKQIKFADLRGFIRNGNSMTATRHGIVPFTLSIHNFSRHITAHNVHYSLSSDYGYVFYEDENNDLDINNMRHLGRRDLYIPITPALHHSMPARKNFYIALPEWQGIRNLQIGLAAYADHCPAKVSIYHYECFETSRSPTPNIRLIKAEENNLAYELTDSLGKTEEERALEKDTIAISMMQKNWPKTPMYKKLDP